MFLENYIIELCQQVSIMQPNEIRTILPEKNYKYFKEIMEGIIKFLKRELLEFSSINDPEFVSSCKELDEKLNICENYLKESKSEDYEVIGKKNLIFATSESEKQLIESDIKGIEPEYYDRILVMLERIKDDVLIPGKYNNLNKEANLKGIIYQKEFATRIYYMNIDFDSVYILIVKTKHDQKLSKRDLSELFGRKKQVEKIYQELKQKFKDPELKEQIVTQNKMVYQNIVDYLNTNKRGEKKLEVGSEVLPMPSVSVKAENSVEDAAEEIIVSSTQEESLPESSVAEPEKESTTEIVVADIEPIVKSNEIIEVQEKNKRDNPIYVKRNKKWYENYQLAKEYYEKHGHLVVKKRSGKLGEWLHNQRNAYKRGELSLERIQLLEAIGMIWDQKNKKLSAPDSTYQNLWDGKYQLAKEYYEKHGNLDIVRSHPVLGEWIHTQRREYKKRKLSKDRIYKLEAIGMIWRKVNKKTQIQTAVVRSEDTQVLKPLNKIISDIDLLEDRQLSTLEQQIKIIKKKRLDSIITLYENLLELSKQGPNALTDFELRIENDTETINEIAKRK